MAETRKKSTSTKSKTKTKTVPAKKPATKPAGKSVTPKATKTVKKSPAKNAPAKKTTKTVKTSQATAKATTTTKSTSANSASAKASVKKHCRICKIIFAVIVAVAVVAVATWTIACIINKASDDTVKVENGKGEKVSLKYASPEGYNYRVLVPASFKELSAEENKNDYGTSDAPELVYADADDTVNIAFSAPNNSLTNDQIKEYLSAMKTILSTTMDVLETSTYETGDHTIGTIKLVSDFEDEEVYNQMAFFSYEGKLAIITFNCRAEARAEWEKVGDEIIKSINFTE